MRKIRKNACSGDGIMTRPICPNCFWKGGKEPFPRPPNGCGLFLWRSEFGALHRALGIATPRDAVVHAAHARHAAHATQAAHPMYLARQTLALAAVNEWSETYR